MERRIFKRPYLHAIKLKLSIVYKLIKHFKQFSCHVGVRLRQNGSRPLSTTRCPASHLMQWWSGWNCRAPALCLWCLPLSSTLTHHHSQLLRLDGEKNLADPCFTRIEHKALLGIFIIMSQKFAFSYFLLLVFLDNYLGTGELRGANCPVCFPCQADVCIQGMSPFSCPICKNRNMRCLFRSSLSWGKEPWM